MSVLHKIVVALITVSRHKARANKVGLFHFPKPKSGTNISPAIIILVLTLSTRGELVSEDRQEGGFLVELEYEN